MTPKEKIAAWGKAYREANKKDLAAKKKAYREANKEKLKEYYEANKEKIAARGKAYREANKEKIAARGKAYREANKEKLKEYYDANKEKKAARSKAYREANKERILLTEWKRQGLPRPTTPRSLFCDICGCPPVKRDLVLDHCHETGQFRGWLCFKCNTSIGKLGDNVEGVRRALEYLERFEQGNDGKE